MGAGAGISQPRTRLTAIRFGRSDTRCSLTSANARSYILTCANSSHRIPTHPSASRPHVPSLCPRWHPQDDGGPPHAPKRRGPRSSEEDG